MFENDIKNDEVELRFREDEEYESPTQKPRKSMPTEKVLELLYEKLILDPEHMLNATKEPQKCVTLITLHSSKGLEFPFVYIINAQDGIIPHAFTSNIDEERRSLYVGDATLDFDKMHS